MTQNIDYNNFDDKELSSEQNAEALIWGGDGPVVFVPRAARMVDSTQDKRKFSVLVLGELLVQRKFKDKAGDEVTAPPGTRVGVWVSGGSQKLLYLADQPVKIEPTGREIDVGKGNPMREFSIKTRPNIVRKLLQLEADFRDSSAKAEAPWKLVASSPKQLVETSGEDVPF